MSATSKFDPLQFEIIKKAIPFVVDDVAEFEDDTDSELDFSIADVDEGDEGTESESETVKQTVKQSVLEQSTLRLGNIHTDLTAWRTNGVTEDILDDLRGEFHALKEEAVSAGFDDVSRLSHVVVRLLEQSDKPISNDSSLLNLLEEMHDGLAAELGLISITGEDHISSLISMVQLLLTDEPANPIETTSDMLEEYSDGSHGNQAHSIEDAIEDAIEDTIEYSDREYVEVQAIQTEADAILQTPVLQAPALQIPALQIPVLQTHETTTSQVLLVKVGTYQVALLIRNIDRVMRVHESEIQLLDGQHCVALGEQQVPLINLAARWGEACLHADAAFRFLVVSRSQDNIDTNGMVAFEVDQFLEVTEIVVKAAGSQLASIGGIVGVTILADASLVLVLAPEQLIGFEVSQC